MEAKKVKERKKLTKKQIVVIAVTCALVAVAAIVVPIGVVFGATTEVKPKFLQFDQLSDSQIVAEWNSVSRADSYEIEYVYGSRTEENVKKVQTTATRYAVTRKRGVLSLRVKSNVSKQFSEWITLDVSAMKLKTPTVSIGSDLKINWSSVYYDYLGERTAVGAYGLKLSVATDTSIEVNWIGNEYEHLKEYILAVSPPQGDDDFEEFDVTVMVKALAKPKFSVLPTDAELFLQDNFAEGEYGAATITITEDIYEGLIK